MKKVTVFLLVLLLPLIQLSAAVNASDALRCIHYRGNLDNSMHAISVGKKATVAFLGGSITEMKGWKDMVEEDLKTRFPETDFTFIEAGISSLGSTPHAFRFEEDVLGKGIPDLLFVEAAVNDDTNHFGPREQILGMEGIVRHALKVNPMMDIIMLHFIYDPFLPIVAAGKTPEVVLNHEKVAEHYEITSVDLVREIGSRIAAGELTWEQFGGTHPAPLGHEYYAASIGRVLDRFTKRAEEYSVKAHVMPEAIEKNCYSRGCQIPYSKARKLVGFHDDPSWHPSDGADTRALYTDVPTLVTENGGSLVFRFKGRAVGIYHVCGPEAGRVSYSIDGGEWKTIDTYTEWSSYVHLPWVTMFSSDLRRGRHTLRLRVEDGQRSGCFIKSFVVNR
jgi:hypothetical protein